MRTLQYESPTTQPAPLPDGRHMIGGKEGSLSVDFKTLSTVLTPEPTHRKSTGNISHNTLPFADFANAVRDIGSDILGSSVLNESYVLARIPQGGNETNAQQMYGRMVWASPYGNDHGIAAVFRASHDTSIALTLGMGMSTFICANGMMSADHMGKLKHTMNMPERLPLMVCVLMGTATEAVRAEQKRLEAWQDVPMCDDFFYAYTGILVGRPDNPITPTIGNAARRYWRDCRAGNLHDAHGTPTLASAFQAVTAGLHRASPRNVFGSFAGLNHVTDAIAATGGSLSGIPKFELNIEEYE